MSGAAHRILPLEGQVKPRTLRSQDLDRLFEVADRSRFGGVAGLAGNDYAGQGYTEVPSHWLCEIIVRLKVAEEACHLRSMERTRPPSSFWQGVLDRPVLDGPVLDEPRPDDAA